MSGTQNYESSREWTNLQEYDGSCVVPQTIGHYAAEPIRVSNIPQHNQAAPGNQLS